MPEISILVAVGIALALVFDFGNGFKDASNSIATVVATRVLKPWQAVALAAFFNFVAAFVFGTSVAATIGKGLVQSSAVNEVMIISGIIGAIVWVYSMAFFGLPISASHALIGGFIGAAVAGAGIGALIVGGLFTVVLFIFAAPIIGMVSSFLFSAVVLRLVRRADPSKVSSISKKLQLVSVSAYSLAHGTNDAQKTMGIISILLFTGGYLGSHFYVPWWVIIISHTTIALGTLLGGWKVVKTMGMKITKLKPLTGFFAETSGAAVIIVSTVLGIPVSTTHVIAGSIIGVGMTKRISAVHWSIARSIIQAWIFTIPATALIGGLTYFVLRLFVHA